MLHPIDPVTLTQGFDGNQAVYAQFGLNGHNGLDYRTKLTDTPTGKRNVRAPYWGTVIETGDEKKAGYGKYLRLTLLDGSQAVLGHLDSFKVKVSDSVAPGDVIAVSDNTGFSSAAHLHFGYRPPKWNINNGFKGYVDQSAFLTSDLQKVLNSHPMPPSNDFAHQFQGKILIAVEDKGRKWYVWDGRRYEIDKAPAFELKLQVRPPPAFAVFINNIDLAKIPVA